jgi:PAS domain S-box-containing protein
MTTPPTSSPWTTGDRECRLFHALPGVYYILRYANLQWEVTAVSHQCENLFGYTESEVYAIATTFLQSIILPEDRQLVTDSKKAAFLEERLFDMEFRIRTKKGEIKYVRDQYLCYQHGEDWIMEGYLSETFRSSIKDRLIQQLRSYREAVDVTMISSITDRKGKIVYANENFCRVSKYSMWELVGQNHRIINSSHHTPEFFQAMWKTISSGNVWHGEILNRAKDGTRYWIDTVIIPIFNESKLIVNYLSLRMLINERKEAELERKKYIHLLEQIAFIVAHNVRGPLCSILGLTNLLQEYTDLPQDVKTAIMYLKESSGKLDTITKTLSQFVYDNEIEMRLKEYRDDPSRE